MGASLMENVTALIVRKSIVAVEYSLWGVIASVSLLGNIVRHLLCCDNQSMN